MRGVVLLLGVGAAAFAAADQVEVLRRRIDVLSAQRLLHIGIGAQVPGLVDLRRPAERNLRDLNRPGDRVPEAIRAVALTGLRQKRGICWNWSARERFSDWAVTGRYRNISVDILLRITEKAEAVDQLIAPAKLLRTK